MRRAIFKERTFITALALLALAALFLSGTGRKAGDAKAQAATDASYLEDVKVLNIQHGKTNWEVRSNRVNLSADGKDARMEDVTISVPDENLTMKAPEGRFDMEKDTLDLSGQIVTEAKGFSMETGQMKVVPGGKVDAGSKVVLKGKGMRIEGTGMEAGEERTLRLRSNVKAIFE